MKKITLLLCMCLAAWCVPQKVWGTVTPSWDGTSKILTIETTAAGELTRSAVESYYDAETIVLKGYFNSSDLEALKAKNENGATDNGFNNVKEVDMSEARFVKAASSSNYYQLFHGSASGTGTQAVENATLYQWVNTPKWEQITWPTPADGETVYDYPAAPNDVTGRSVGDYGRVPSTVKYLQMSVTNESWNGPVSPAPSSYTTEDWLEHELNGKRSDYKNGKSVRIKRYYRKQVWQRFTGSAPTSGTILNGNHYGEVPYNANSNALDNFSGVNGSYIWFYVYYKWHNGAWERLTEYDNANSDPTQGEGAITANDISDIAISDDAIKKNDYPMNNYNNEGNIVRVRWYYHKEENNWKWVQCFPTSYDLSAEGVVVYDGAEVGADMNNLLPNMGNTGSYIWFYVYYTKNETRNWDGETTEAPSKYKTADFDYAYRDNHKMEYNNGDWVKMSSYDYYQVKLTGPAHWEYVTYNNGETYPISKFFDSGTTLATLNDGTHNGSTVGEYAVVGGPKMSYINNAWVAYDESATVPDYSQMDFRYWKSTITKAITSKYADGTIENTLFEKCYKLTNIEYLGGVVKGLNDHSPSEYANYEILIGKDVTEIASAAFNQSRSLTKITFDKDYSSLTEEELANYPKQLTIGNNAFNDCNNLLEVEIPNRTVSIGNNAFAKVGNSNIDKNDITKEENKSREFKLSFQRRCHDDGLDTKTLECSYPLTIGEAAFLDCYFLKELSLPIRLETLGGDAFKNTLQLGKLEMRETTKCKYTPTNHLLKTIPNGAFSGSGVKEVIIPKCVTLIENNAFGSTNHLEKVTFQEQDVTPQEPLVIKGGAFAYGDESVPNLHVYVNIHPADRKVICEYNAFNFTQMMGQTSTTNEHRGTLHFKKEDWDYYQGDWKKGLSFRQENLNAFKDGYNGTYKKVVNEEEKTIKLIGLASEENRANDSNFAGNDAVNGKYTLGTGSDEEYAPANGWQQFAGTSTGIDLVIPGGTFIRTYSTTTTYDIPKAMINLVETNIVKVYRVTGFSDGYDSSSHDINSASDAASADRSATATLVVNTSTNEPCYIPKGTGLIMKGNVNSGSGYLTYFKERATNANEPEYSYKPSGADVNLMAPTSIPSGEPVIVNPTEPYPIWSVNTNTSQNYRIFGLANAAYGDISQYSFGRMKPNQTMPFNRAYLKLPVDMFHWANESVGTTPTYSDAGSGSRIALIFDDEDNGEITGIKTESFRTSSSDGSYYTIQGVKVSRPNEKGLFIHNGKKIIVK